MNELMNKSKNNAHAKVMKSTIVFYLDYNDQVLEQFTTVIHFLSFIL